MNFVIFASPRSGSSCLVNIFESQDYKVLFEPFNSVLRNDYYDRLRKEKLSDIVNEIMSNYSGLKHLSGQGGEIIDTYLINHFKTVTLKRKNLLAASLSYCVSTKIGVWQKKNLVGGEYEKIGRIDPMMVRRAMGRIRHIEKYNAKFCIYYEDLIGKNGLDLVKNIFEYCECKIHDTDKIKELLDHKNKMNCEETYSKIENYDEIKDMGNKNIGWL